MNPKLKQILESYLKRGFYIFPLNGKRPMIKDNLNQASNSIEQIEAWAKTWPNCNWGLSLAKSKLMAVDVDRKHGAFEAWAAMIEQKGEPTTLKQITGSGGFHYLFNAPEGSLYVGKIMPGIDIKHHGFVVIYPSIHPTTKRRYEWAEWKRAIDNLPTWLVDLTKKDVRAVNTSSSVSNFGKGYLEKLVDELTRFPLTYEEWVQAGMAIHASKPDAEGMELYIKLTLNSPSYVSGDEEKAAYKWERFTVDRTSKVTTATLGYLIRQKGGVVPNPNYAEDIELFKRGKLEAQAIEKEKEDWLICKGSGKYYSRNAEWIIEQFNEQGFAVLADGIQKEPVIKIKDPGRGRVELLSQPIAKLNVEYANKVFRYTQELKTTVKTVDVPAFKPWLESHKRTEFKRVVFWPNRKSPDAFLNLWRGIPCEGSLGGIETFLKVFFESLCGGNQVKGEWLLDFLAHMVQRPEEKPTVVPVLIGPQGTGKGLLNDYLLKTILQDLYLVLNSSERITARFNMEQGNRLLTVIDEASWRGNKTEDGILKNLTGSPFITLEEKFGLSITIENFSRYIISSNNVEAVAIEAGNRRYVVIESSKEYAGNTEFFNPVFEEIRNGDLAQRFYTFLMGRDISGFKPFAVPAWDDGGEIAKIKTEGPVAEFWVNTFYETNRPVWVNHPTRGVELSHPLAFSAFQEFQKENSFYQRGISPLSFWSQTEKIVKGLPPAKVVGVSKGTARVRWVTPSFFGGSLARTLRIAPPESINDADFIAEEFEAL